MSVNIRANCTEIDNMFASLSSNPLYTFFLLDKKKNFRLASGMLLSNFIAALLEGLSFAFLLVGFLALNGERPPLLQRAPDVIVNLSQNNLFILSLLGAVIGQLLRSTFVYFGQISMNMLTVNLQALSQKRIYEQLFRLTYRNINRYKTGDLIHHATAPPTYLPQIMDGVNKICVSLMMIVGYLIFMGYLSLLLTISIVFLFLTTAVAQQFLMKRVGAASKLQAIHNAELSTETSQNLEGLKTVHLFGRHEYVLKKVEHALKAIAASTLRLQKLSSLVLPINEMIAILGVFVAMLLGLVFLSDRVAVMSFLMTYLTLTYRLATRLQIIMTSWGSIAYNFGPFSRMQSILKNEDKEFLDRGGLKNYSFKDSICFERISFTYPEKTEDALYEFSLTVPKGETVAFVGPSGGGKSTLLALLMRLYEPSSGRILIDQKPITELSLNYWRSLFGVVNQDTFLFHESITSNIRFGKVDATQDEIIQAAKLAGAHEFIEKLPQGYQTLIGEKGHRLSGGERQRLSLARALVRKPQVLVLDEATSSLDSQSEKVVQHALDQLQGQMTIVVVAHRLSTIVHADRIFVFDKGKIVEDGSHKSLLLQNGLYANFWKLQSLTL